MHVVQAIRSRRVPDRHQRRVTGIQAGVCRVRPGPLSLQLAQVWADYDQKSKQIVDAAGVVAQMYPSLPKDE
jgi:hypothetical protein